MFLTVPGNVLLVVHATLKQLEIIRQLLNDLQWQNRRELGPTVF